MIYWILYTKTFQKQIQKIKDKDKTLSEEAMKRVEKLQETPYLGKPLKYGLFPYRSVRIRGKYRLIYRIYEEEKKIILIALGHRKEVYRFMLLSSTEKDFENI
ncbi:MAG: type II toxin-antitoxin system RelE/ParE family toxin [Methanomicrobia archaeon]|nr:type II toxin-antitoxin system RelE/ParE family toxin [Methanomicrobia archaeon]